MLIPLLYAETASLFDYLPSEAILLLNEPQRILDEAKAAELVFAETVAATLERGEGHSLQASLLMSAERFASLIDSPRTAALYALFRTSPQLTHRARVHFTVEPAPQYLSDFGRLVDELTEMRNKKRAVLLFAGEGYQRITEQFNAIDLPYALAPKLTRSPEKGEILVLSDSLPQGFVFPELQLVVLTSFELFGKRPSSKTRRKTGMLREADLVPGDLVVHEVHGIGRFMGVEQLTVQNSTRDYLLFAYRGDDRLYIPTDQLDRVQKYIGTDEEHPSSVSVVPSAGDSRII